MQIYLVDSFTTTKFQGNPAGVVLDGDDLTDAHKQMIAAEIHASETAFITSSEVADFKVRFFTPTTEVNFCGHATVAAFHTLASLGKIRLQNGTANLTEETLAGIIPITISRQDNLIYITMTQKRLVIPELKHSAPAIAKSLGIAESSLDIDFPPMLIDTGNCHLVVGVKQDVLNGINYNSFELGQILADTKCITAHVFARQNDKLYHARNFCPTVGIPEDPATGSAAGAFGAYLCHIGHIQQPVQEFQITQGEKMGRPSHISVAVHTSNGSFERVEVSGTAVPSFKFTDPETGN